MSARNCLRILGMVFFFCGTGVSSEAQVGPVVKWPFVQIGAGVNKALLFVESRPLFRSVTARDRDPGSGPKEGVAPLFGGFGDGSGLAGGLQYTKPFAEGWRATVSGRLSTHAYQRYVFSLNKEFGRVRTGPELMWESLPEEDFYGEGSKSAESARSTYGVSGPRAAWVTAAKLGPVELRHSLRWDRYDLFAGRDNRFPTTQETFTPAEVSGGYSDSQFLTNQLAAVLDYRDDPKDPRAGTMVTGAVEVRNGIRQTAANFTTLRLAHYLYVPLSERKAHLFAFRTEAVHNMSDDAIPFYLEPTLGGGNSLRGFREYRFRDNDALIASAEYRYRIWRYMDAVIFGDAGQVYSNVFKDAAHTKMQADYGGGLRMNTPIGLQMRLNIGHSSEGTRFWFKLGAFTW